MENLKYKKLRMFYVSILFITAIIEVAMGLLTIFLPEPSKVFSIVALIAAVLFILFTILNISNNNKELKSYKEKE